MRTLKERVVEAINQQVMAMELYAPDDDISEYLGYLIGDVISTVRAYEQEKAAFESRRKHQCKN